MEIESEIIKYINEYKKEEYSKVIENDTRLEIILSLSEIRGNIVSWYPFKENSEILEVGADFGQITGRLCDKASKVVAIESSEEKRKAIVKRHEDRNNLTVIEKIEQIEEEFDYITIIGLEYITDLPKELLTKLKKYLKKDGKILIATDNKFGIKYFSTTNNTGEEITHILGRKIYQLNELIKQIEEVGFQNKKIYYPMTDYKLTNVIYTDKELLSKNNLSRNIIYSGEDTIKFYEQNNVYRELLKDDSINLKAFLNSFLIEIFNGEYQENDIRLVAFSNMRKPQYRIKTIMKKDFVYKYPENELGKEHIEKIKENIDIMNKLSLKTLDTYDEEKIISKYSEEKTLDKVMIEWIKKDKNKVAELIQRFKQELMQKLEVGEKESNVFDKYHIKYNKEILENMTFVKNGLWDLTFENCFYINGEFYFYDQEWREENLPIDFILYRAIKYFDGMKQHITEEELYNILSLNQEQIKIFDELDNKIQEEIRNKIFWKIHTQGKTFLDFRNEQLGMIESLTSDNQQKDKMLQQKDEMLQQRDEIIQQKEVHIQNLTKELEGIYDSRSWKAIETLRKIKNRGAKGE